MPSVFYAWQSDLPHERNLDLIESALERATRELRDDATIGWMPEVDRDTKGMPGSPDVTLAIFEKIADADVCVFDVSIAIRAGGIRPSPNPNVMLELGYALRAHPLERILLVFNEAFGTTKELPFDIGYKRLLLYRTPEAGDLDSVRDDLADRLREQLRAAHQAPRPTRRTAEETRRIEQLKAVLHDPFQNMLSATGGVFLWAERDEMRGYRVLTEQNKRNLIPPRDLRGVVRYDPGTLRFCAGAFPEERVALEELASKRGMKILPEM